MPWVVVSIETFGDLVNFHLHPHCLVTDGCVMANDWFYVLLEKDISRGKRKKEKPEDKTEIETRSRAVYPQILCLCASKITRFFSRLPCPVSTMFPY